jgi:uncharacterized protein (TIGR03118 family)
MKTSMTSTLALSALAVLSLNACDDTNNNAPALFSRKDLVSDQPGMAVQTDPQLVNPWGLAFGLSTFFWVANNGTATSTLYDGDGNVHSDVVGGPVSLPVEGEEAGPTGVVFNGGDGFQMTSGDASGPARFIFATMSGQLIAWSADVDPRNAVVVADDSANGSRYFGLAILTSGSRTLLYAADFPNRQIDVYDQSFHPAGSLAQSAFIDPQLPTGYAPFGIQAIEGRIYVAYAQLNAGSGDEEAGPGNGYVSVFDADGAFIARVASRGLLNAPWGMTRAPASFGDFGGALLIGNFGDGRITAYDAQTYQVLGQLESDLDKPIAIPGLWAISFGNGAMAGEENDLYFTAGPGDEMHGIFGEISSLSSEDQFF